MTPLLFPYTYLSPGMLAAAARFFSELTLYQPAGDCLADDLAPWVEEGFLKVRVPDSGDGQMVADALKEYLEWARQHRGGRHLHTVLPPGSPRRPPFFGDTATAQILSDLKGAGENGATDGGGMFAARLFLALAQHWDREQHELDRRLEKAEADARALIGELQSGKSEAGSTAVRKPGGPRQGRPEMMLPERLDAWRRLFLADTLDTVLLLTTSRSIVSDIVAAAEKAEVLLRLNAGKTPRLPEAPPGSPFRDSLMETLETICRRPWPTENRAFAAHEDAGEAADLSLYIIPDRSARMFMTGLKAAPAAARIQPSTDGSAPQHFIVGFLNPDGPGGELE